jgi:putative membrane protein
VYRSGDDPDYRFSFANERTFLAWVRTAVLCVAAAWFSWALAERAVRQGQALPGIGFGLVVAVVIAGVGVAIVGVLA